ncbi:TrmB family transcriptional regulator [Haladaptatus salinisoli]|uniref:TrmB family transcriptional regulator n=1 Tax=Haladaptatus salinisoli TaxID=2884876 RepID=UPI001D0AB496|nr:helix-turn-helix domain-containing protein [Haladaptatus salinisoli]
MGTSLADDFEIYLHEIGLSEYEARAYLGVLQSGTTTAKEISDAADIPQSRVYDVLESLESKGFVTIQPGRPKKFGPIEPELAITQFVQHKRSNMEAEIKRSRNIGDKFLDALDGQQFQYRQNDEIDVFWSYKGKNYILKQFGQYCRSATDEVLMITKGNSFERVVSTHKETLRDRHDHGVDIRIIVPKDEVRDIVLDTANKWATVQNGDAIEGRIYLFDSKRVLVTWLSDQEDRFVAMATQSSQLQNTIRQLFELAWSDT